MKRCPKCNRVESDDTLAFCRLDGTVLIGESGPVSADAGTVKLPSAPVASEIETGVLRQTITDPGIGQPVAPTTVLSKPLPRQNTRELSKPKRRTVIVAIAAVIIVSLIACLYLYRSRGKNAAPIESIAVLPFQNKSSDADTEYLSDGLADSLIYRLSQLPNLKVSPTSSVIRYKGKETDIAQIAKELEVDAVMSGRVPRVFLLLRLFASNSLLSGLPGSAR